MFLIITNQIFKMLLLMLVGYLCYRLKLMDQNSNKVLANLLLMVINPVLVIMSLQTDYSLHLVSGLLTAFALAAVSHLAAILITRIFIKPSGNPDYSIDRFSCVYTNCAFMGIPLAQSIFGSDGVLYITAYSVIFNLLAWTHGVSVMTGASSLKDLKKGLRSPMIIACTLGLILFFTQVRVPSVIADTMNYIGGMNTPLAMMIAGASVAQTDLLQMLRNKKIYVLTLIKLLLVPAVTLGILTLIRADFAVACTILLASACPSAATCTMFALRFQKNYRHASEIYAFTTLCSLATIPLFIYAAEGLLA